MKRKHSGSNTIKGLKTACTVSAAALMLGVSQAATVGLHFQVNYCYDARYSGFNVSMTAFGIASNAWQNLTPMDTGYGCASGKGPYTLNQVIDTTTASGGLHPLPNGSLNVTWAGDTANFSGFAGYGGKPPGYDYGGPPPVPIPTGEWQIYSSFIRDGVNFGPNNLLPQYSIDITGLQSLFTNSPYVIELIAASDSMQTLTNAFIIDAALNSTQSVIYPNTPFPSVDWGGTGGWFRGHGGGLSTVSTPLTTDHVKIMGNHAENGVGSGYPGFDRASTISGFIVTDKPVVSMSPNSVLASPADTVTLSAYAIGVPPLSYQWRHNGQPIGGTTTILNLTLTDVGRAQAGDYDLVVTNAYGSTTSKVAVVTVDNISATPGRNFVLDSNPQNTEFDGVNYGATWQASSLDAAGTNRLGLMSFDAGSSNQIVVPGNTNFNSTTGTVMFWMRSSGVANATGKPATLIDRKNGHDGNGFVLALNTDGTIRFQSNGGNLASFSGPFADGNWHFVVLTYDQSATGQEVLYVDGLLAGSTGNTAAWSWNPGQELELGFSNDPADWQPYNGLLDDVRVYNRALTAVEVAAAFLGPLIDNSALVLRLNFDAAPSAGMLLRWQCPDAILQSAPVVTGPYTDIPPVLSPYAVGARAAAKFFRYNHHTPTNLVSNPYLM